MIMTTPKDIFIVHHSVFHDAFRTDYQTQFRQSSKDFFDLLLRHYIKSGCKIAHTSREVFDKMFDSPIARSKAFWIIPSQLVEIDLRKNPNLRDLEKSVIRLASRKSAKYIPHIVATKPKDKINTEGTNHLIFTPREAIDFYNNQGRF